MARATPAARSVVFTNATCALVEGAGSNGFSREGISIIPLNIEALFRKSRRSTVYLRSSYLIPLADCWQVQLPGPSFRVCGSQDFMERSRPRLGRLHWDRSIDFD